MVTPVRARGIRELVAGALGAGAAVSVLTLARRADARLRPIEAAPPSSLPPVI
jgi:hypothetical protein